MSKMKLALIGYGGMGKQHLKRIQQNNHLEVIAVYDIDQEKYYDLPENIQIHPSFSSVLHDKEIDGIIISTPNDVHHDLAVEAMQHGKHVICEKPVTMNHQELKSIMETAEKEQKIFMVNQNRRWDEGYLIVKQLLDAQKLDKLYYLENRVMGSRGIPHDWRRRKKEGGDMLLDWGVHLIDRILLLFPGEKVQRIYATLNYFLGHEVDDGFQIILHFTSGKRATLEVGTSNFVELPEWYVVGSTGTAVIDDYDLNGKYVTLTGQLAKDAIPVETGAGLTKTMAPRTDDSIAEHPLPSIFSDVNEFYDNFAEVVRGEAEPIVKNEEVLRVMKLIDASFTSAKCGQVVLFEEGV